MHWASETWTRLAALPLQIDGAEFPQHRLPLPHFERVTTIITLQGGGEQGLGEDVTYEAEEHEPQRARPSGQPPLDPAGRWTLGSFCEAVAAADLFPSGAPDHDVSRRYRRWAWESAALDLALRQAGLTLGDALGRAPQPLRFVSSARVGNPPSLDGAEALREAAPGLEFKLDADGDWSDDFLAELGAAGYAAAIDLKAYYVGTVVDVEISPEHVVRIAEALPDVTLEDVEPGRATELIAARWPERLSWDAPIHGVDDIRALPIAPRRLNVKPSRIGSIAELLRVYEHIETHGIAAYAGGQFELGVGRGQIMLLASLMHPGGANDCAPAVFHAFEPGAKVPSSPLPAPAAGPGFRWPGD